MIAAGFYCYTLRAGEAAIAVRPLLCVPAKNRHVGWLVAPDAATLEINGEGTTGPAIAVRLEHDVAKGLVKLQHALQRRVVLTSYADPHHGLRQLGFRHLGRVGQQDFWLDQVESAQMDPAVGELAGELCGTIGTPVRFADMLEALRSARLRAALADAALRCLPPDELEQLARHLLTSPADLALLQAAMPKNPWLERRLPTLIAWRQARAQGRQVFAIPSREPSADLAGARGSTTHEVTTGLALTAYARAATPPGRMACVLATARNEGATLLEWIAYHRAIGFEHVFLYTNDNTDGSDELLQLLCDAGIITWFQNQIQPQTLPQHRAYGHALAVMPQILDYRWTMIADLDEYVGFDTTMFFSIVDYLGWQEQRRADAIALPWKNYIARPGDFWHDAPCIERFVLRDAQISEYVKMIFRTNRAWSANPHHPEPVLAAAFAHRSERGGAHVGKNTPAETRQPTAQCAWMSHYAFRSAPEMIMKLGRGRADHPAESQVEAAEKRIRHFVAQLRTIGLVEDKSTLRCGIRQAEELARLLEIPGLSACQAEVRRNYAARMAQACAAYLDEAAACGSVQGKALGAILLDALAARDAAAPTVRQSLAWKTG